MAQVREVLGGIGISQRQFSNHASSRFFHLVDVIASAHEPTQTQLAALERSYHSTGEFLAECSAFGSSLVQVHPHGSRQLGTIVRPRDSSREGFDIDLIVRLKKESILTYEGTLGPARLLNDLHTALSTYARRHDLKLVRWERCVTLEYAGNMSADIAPVIDAPLYTGAYGETHGLIPDRELRRFNPTNPKGYVKFFDSAASISPLFTTFEVFASDQAKRADVVPLPDAQEVFDRWLCRLVQLLKLHRNVAFGRSSGAADVAPASVFLTTLATMAYAIEASRPHTSPLTLLLDIVDRMPTLFTRRTHASGAEEWILPNPAVAQDNLAEGMNSAAKQRAFLEWHQRLLGELTAIVQAIETYSGIDVLYKLISRSFGERSANAVLVDQTPKKSPSSTRPLASAAIGLVAGSVSSSAAAAARPHTFFGDE